MDSKEKQRKKPCYGKLRCWNNVQVRCPVYSECYELAHGVRMLEKVKTQNKQLRTILKEK
jgi:hypothetical protein